MSQSDCSLNLPRNCSFHSCLSQLRSLVGSGGRVIASSLSRSEQPVSRSRLCDASFVSETRSFFWPFVQRCSKHWPQNSGYLQQNSAVETNGFLWIHTWPNGLLNRFHPVPQLGSLWPPATAFVAYWSWRRSPKPVSQPGERIREGRVKHKDGCWMLIERSNHSKFKKMVFPNFFSMRDDVELMFYFWCSTFEGLCGTPRQALAQILISTNPASLQRLGSETQSYCPAPSDGQPGTKSNWML